ncbi:MULTISPECIES: MFS transporter [unclassified Streptomyces]|uniref:MFS transporter n=1 Tax=unclassified Streptomyces TaxID=2593676 RepID=UPI001BEAA845|nr:MULTISPECIES: MFS transporter [unclassified Streptomyces]MBT2405159.1 MFS transporter [Streptomyces sp. ISL-21]MBT2610927.1 MFS transporter [Streptomyces sp. ISL-87]
MYVADSRGTPAPAVTPEPSAVAPGTSPGRRAALAPTVLALGTVSLITDVSSEMVTAVLPLYLVAGLGLSPLGFGLLDGLYNGVSALVRLTGGHLGDRFGRHKALAGTGYGLSALCKPLLLLAHTLPAIGAVLALDRTGKGLRTAPRDALISLAAAPEDRGRAFGVHRAMDTAGALIGPILAFLILRGAADGYDAVFTVSACVAVLGVLVLVLFVPGRRTEPAAHAEPVSLKASFGLLRRRDLRRIGLCALLLGLCTVSDGFVFLLLQRATGISDRWFALLPLGTAAAFFLLALPLGRLADRIGRWRVFLGGHLALLAAYGLLLAGGQHGQHPALPYAVLLLHGSFYAATDGVLMAAAAGAVPEEHRGGGLALVQTGQSLARFAASLCFGAAWTVWGARPALAGAAALLAVAAAVCVRLRPADA